MLRDTDEYDTGIDCPVCHRTFSTYARLDDHMEAAEFRHTGQSMPV